MPSAFLSDTWIADANAILLTHAETFAGAATMIANVVVNDPPKDVSPDTRELHIGNTSEGPTIGVGLHDAANVTLRTDYETAISIFLSGDPQAGLNALMAGKVKISGDLAALMAASTSGVGPGNPALATALKDITL